MNKSDLEKSICHKWYLYW